MANETRLSLAVPTEPRDVSVSKDALLNNAFIEQSKVGTMYAVKRPGFSVGTEGITTGLNRGIFFHNGTVWYVDDTDTLQGFVPPPSGAFSPAYYVVLDNQDFA